MHFDRTEFRDLVDTVLLNMISSIICTVGRHAEMSRRRSRKTSPHNPEYNLKLNRLS